MADPKLDVYLSTPVQSRVTGTWTFFLSRKIHGKSGQVLGLILTGLRVEFFTDFYKALNGKSDKTFQLLRDDGILIARFPTRDDFLGRSFRDASALGLGLLERADDSTTATRLPRLTDPNDKRLRIVSPRRVQDYPLVVNVLIFDDEFLDQWRSVAWQIGTMASALAALILALTLALARLLSNQEATMRELDQSRLAAEAAMHAKSEFLAMMSHEIRTPINAVIGMSDMPLESALPERERRFARIVSDSASHLLNIINSILDFSRLEAGHDELNIAPLEIRGAIGSALELARSLPGGAGLAITAEIADDVPEFVAGDAGRLNQVLFNLLGNAVKFTEHGNVRLSVSRSPVIAPEAPLRLRFAVADTGPGVTPAMAERLFKPFEQGDQRVAENRAVPASGWPSPSVSSN